MIPLMTDFNTEDYRIFNNKKTKQSANILD